MLLAFLNYHWIRRDQTRRFAIMFAYTDRTTGLRPSGVSSSSSIIAFRRGKTLRFSAWMKAHVALVLIARLDYTFY